MTAVHEAMRNARRMKDISQQGLADAAGINRTLLCEYETGKVKPTIFNLITLADALGISIDEYVGHKVKRTARTARRRYNRAPEDTESKED